MTSGRWISFQTHPLHMSPKTQVERGKVHTQEEQHVQRTSCRESWLIREAWSQLGKPEELVQVKVARLLGPGYTGFVGHGKILSFTLSAMNSLGRILGLGGRSEVVEASVNCGSCSANVGGGPVPHLAVKPWACLLPPPLPIHICLIPKCCGISFSHLRSISSSSWSVLGCLSCFQVSSPGLCASVGWPFQAV